MSRAKEAAFMKLLKQWSELCFRVELALSVRALRQYRGMSRIQLAKASGAGYPTILRIEHGLFMGRVTTIERIATALNTRINVRMTP